MKSRLQLTIADFHVHLSADFIIKADEGHQPFISISDTGTSDIQIDCHPLHSLPFSTDNMAFQAANDTQLFYRIYTIETGLGFIIYLPISHS